MLTKTELKFLMNLKRFQNMAEEQIEEELINLIGNQNALGKIKKELNKERKNCEKYKENYDKVKEELKRKNKEIFNLKNKVNLELPEKETRGNSVATANVHQLKRILCLLKAEEKPMTKNKVFRACGMITKQGESGIRFLENHKMIEKLAGGQYAIC